MFFSWGGLIGTSPFIPLQSVLQSSSQQAEEINSLASLFYVAAGFILLVVVACTAFVLYRFREKKAQREKVEKVLNPRWEIAMIGVPSLLVAVFLYLNIKTINDVSPRVKNPKPDVVITAHQWWWEARYPSTNAVAANEIHLPAGRRILLKLLAADVIHDWWIPAFGSKMDMVPAQENFLWLTIKEPGEYYGICSEFCGAQHAHMRIKVVAQREADYASWLQQHQQVASASGPQSKGARLFMEKSCGSCHRIEGTAAAGDIGPDLTHLATRKTLLAGLLQNTPQNLNAWISHPQQIKPGANMPDALLDDSTAKAITNYLCSLK